MTIVGKHLYKMQCTALAAVGTAVQSEAVVQCSFTYTKISLSFETASACHNGFAKESVKRHYNISNVTPPAA